MVYVAIMAINNPIHKRIANLHGKAIITLADYAKFHKKSLHALLNSARRQIIPAFREKGGWKIGG